MLLYVKADGSSRKMKRTFLLYNDAQSWSRSASPQAARLNPLRASVIYLYTMFSRSRSLRFWRKMRELRGKKIFFFGDL